MSYDLAILNTNLIAKKYIFACCVPCVSCVLYLVLHVHLVHHMRHLMCPSHVGCAIGVKDTIATLCHATHQGVSFITLSKQQQQHYQILDDPRECYRSN